MDAGTLTGIGILWLAAAGITSHYASKNGCDHRKWYFASLTTGPIAWMALYLKVRDIRERIGPLDRRSSFFKRSHPGDHSKRVT